MTDIKPPSPLVLIGKIDMHSATTSEQNTSSSPTTNGSDDSFKEKASEPDSDTIKMFVGQIPRQWGEKECRQLFEEYGPVYQLNVLRDKTSQLSKGCCFVTFYHRKDAIGAQSSMHNVRILDGMHHAMQVKPADMENKNERKLFIGMLNKKMNENEIKTMFSSFGPIEDCNVLRDSDGKSRGCAFVTYTSRAMAATAIRHMHQAHTMEGCNLPIVVKFADTKRESVKTEPGLAISMTGAPAMAPGILDPCSLLAANPMAMPSMAPMPPQQQQQQQQLNQMALMQQLANINPQYLALLQQAQMLQAPQQVRQQQMIMQQQQTQQLQQQMTVIQQLLAQQAQQQQPQQQQQNISNSNAGSMFAQQPSPLQAQQAPDMAQYYNASMGQQQRNGMANSGAENSVLQSLLGTLCSMLHNPSTEETPVDNIELEAFSQRPSSASEVSAPNAQAQQLLLQQQAILAQQQQQQPQPTSAATTGPTLLQQQMMQQAYAGLGTYATTTATTGPLPTHVNQSASPGAMRGLSQTQREGPTGANLFIYHLPQEFADADLAQLFGHFGQLVSAKVFVDKVTNMSKCFGFVSYDTSPAASAAIQAMNGFSIGNKRLKVQLKRSKEDLTKTYAQM